MENNPDFLQICPYDKAPFRDICRAHASAARLLGWSVHTAVSYTHLTLPTKRIV